MIGVEYDKSAFYVPNQVLLQFTAHDKESNDFFEPNRHKKQGLQFPDWLLNDLKKRFPETIADGAFTVPAYSVSSNGADLTRAIAQLPLAKKTSDPVITFVKEHLGLSKTTDQPDFLDPLTGKGFDLTAVSPNWFSGGQQTIGTGGPGGPPLPLTSGMPKSFIFNNAITTSLKDTKQGEGVDVFILDTFPENSKGAPRGILDVSTRIESNLFAGLVVAGKPAYSAANPYYDMSDHGLFIASIIRNIAPKAKIHLIEALNEYGVGTTMTVAAACDEIAKLRASGHSGTAPSVVNCSFTFSVPIDFALVGWPCKVPFLRYPETDTFLAAWTPVIGKELMTQAGDLFLSILGFRNANTAASDCVMIVAAAGNDTPEPDLSNPNPAPCTPRYPAVLPNVLGVGAMNGTSRAYYSNIPDSPASDGLMTLGTIEGVYTSPFPQSNTAKTKPLPALVPPDSKTLKSAAPGTVNANGFATWSGTSFAAPVIAGLLANLISQPGMTCTAAVKALRNSEPSPVGGGRNLELTTGGEVLTVTQ